MKVRHFMILFVGFAVALLSARPSPLAKASQNLASSSEVQPRFVGAPRKLLPMALENELLRVDGADGMVLEPLAIGGAGSLGPRALERARPKDKPVLDIGAPRSFDVVAQSNGLYEVYGLAYSTFLGGGDYDGATSIAVDASGAMYVTGAATSSDFPTTAGAYDQTHGGGTCGTTYTYTCPDVFVTKLNADGTVAYSTFIGGTGPDLGLSIFVDASGIAYVTGRTTSPDFPTTDGAYDETCGTDVAGDCNFDGENRYTDAFVAKLNLDGTDLTYSSFLGGSYGESGAAIAVDSSATAYVTGVTSSPDFPATTGAYDESCGSDGDCDFDEVNRYGDAFVTKLNADGSGLVYSTFLGGRYDDGGASIALLAADGSALAYVTGSTTSSDFPTTGGGYDDTCGTAEDCNFNGEDRYADAFVTKLSEDGTGLDYSTFLGGSASDTGSCIAVGTSGDAHVTGSTGSSDFPTTGGAFDTSHNGGTDAFVAKLNPMGNEETDLTHGAFFGGSEGDSAASIALDASGAAYVTGSTTSSNLPTTPSALDRSYHAGTCGIPPFYTWPCPDAFVLKLNADGTGLDYSTYLAGASDDAGTGIAVQASGAIFATGGTTSSDFPTTLGAYQDTLAGDLDGYVTKLVLLTEHTYVPLVLKNHP